MKNYEDCLAWMTAVEDYRKAAPEGVHMSFNDRAPNLRDVDPSAITELASHYIGDARCKVEGAADGAFYSLTLTLGGHVKLHRAYRFFYRKTAEHSV